MLRTWSGRVHSRRLLSCLRGLLLDGPSARAILEEAGIHDVLAKSLGSSNAINVARATIAGLRALQRPDEVAKRRGLSAEEFTPKGLLRAYTESERGPIVYEEVR